MQWLAIILMILPNGAVVSGDKAFLTQTECVADIAEKKRFIMQNEIASRVEVDCISFDATRQNKDVLRAQAVKRLRKGEPTV